MEGGIFWIGLGLVILLFVWGRTGDVDAIQREAVGTGPTAIWVAAIVGGFAIFALLMLAGMVP